MIAWENFELGTRLVVRYRISGPLPLSDALGTLVAHDDGTVSIDTRRGIVRVDKAAVVAAKRVPPSRPRSQRPDADSSGPNSSDTNRPGTKVEP